MSLKLAPSDYEIYIPVAEWIEKNIKEWLFTQRPLFKKLSAPIDSVLNGLDSLFNIIPFPLAILIFLYFAFKTNGFKFAILTLIGLVFIDLVDLWSESMTTLAMIFTAVIFCILIGIPLGILSSRSRTFEAIMRPILDVMQTIPSFVYLIPILMLLGIGKIPGLIAVCIYAIPPVIRLTNLGIREVDKEIIEAAESFGATPRQKLYKVQIPLAMPTIFAGINQTIMMALAMVIIASMIGVKGLGLEVLRSITNQYLAIGLLNGTAIVVIAIIFDRISQAYGKRVQEHRKGGHH